jgi:hypothetical protein
VLLAHDIPQAAARFAAAANNDSSTQPLQLAVVQLLANLCAAGEEAAAAAWRALFPAHLERLLCTQQGAVHEAAALAVLSCVRHHPPALLQLTSPVCHRVWLHLLAPMLPQQPVAAAGANSHAATATAISTDSGDHSSHCCAGGQRQRVPAGEVRGAAAQPAAAGAGVPEPVVWQHTSNSHRCQRQQQQPWR